MRNTALRVSNDESSLPRNRRDYTCIQAWLCMHTDVIIHVCCCNFDALAQASDFRIERRQVVFLCWMQDSNPDGLWNRISSRLNARRQTDRAIEDQAKILNSTARPYGQWASTVRPYDQRAFSPLDPTANGHSILALAIYIFFCFLFPCSGTGKRFFNRKETSCAYRRDYTCTQVWLYMHIDVIMHAYSSRYMYIGRSLTTISNCRSHCFFHFVE